MFARARALLLLFVVAHCSGCVGSFDAANTPPQLAPSTTRAHCVALDFESDWGAPTAAGLGAASTGLGAMVALDSNPTKTLRVSTIVTGAAGLVAGGVGMYASKSWHEQCTNPTSTQSNQTTTPSPTTVGLAPTKTPSLVSAPTTP